jgi:hypothetical protein
MSLDPNMGHAPDGVIAVKADEVLNSGDVLGYIVETFQRTVVGEHNVYGIQIIVLAASQRALTNGKGIYIFVNGSMEGGKSWLIRQVLWAFPTEYVVDASMSPQAMFYENQDEAKIYYIDDFNGLNEDMKSALKAVLMNFRRDTVRKVANNHAHKCETYKVPARTAVMFSAVDSIPDQQLMSRLFQIPPAGGDSSKEKIYGYDVATNDGTREDLDAVEDERVKICREVLRVLLSKQVTVLIPFAKEIQWQDAKNSRNYNVLFDLIKLSAILEQRNRQIDSNGRLLATYEDFYRARGMFEPRRQMMTTKLSEGPQKVLNWLAARTGQNFTQAEIVEETGINQGNLSRWLNTIKEMSLVVEDGDVRQRGDRSVPVKVYKYVGEAPKSTIFDVPIELSEQERSKPEYKKWREDYDKKGNSS